MVHGTSIGSLAAPARRVRTLLALLELRVLPLVPLDPHFQCRSARLGERERPRVAEPDAAQRAALGAVAAEEHLPAGRRAAHAQSGPLRVAALLPGPQVGDNRRGQGLGSFQYRFFRHQQSL